MAIAEVLAAFGLLRGSLRQADVPRALRARARSLAVLAPSEGLECVLGACLLGAGLAAPQDFARSGLVALHAENIEGGRGG